MGLRHLASLAAAAALMAAPLAAQAPAARKKSWTMPRLGDGHPDLQGIWTNATITPLERPAQFAGKATVTDAEAAKFENPNNDNLYGDRRSNNAEQDRDHAYNALFFDRGTELARVDGAKRTSLIIDPADGKIPAMTPAASKRISNRMRNRFDSVQDRPLGERCILGFGSTSGPPMMPVLYNNNYQIVQSAHDIMILVEMVHDVRHIHMDRKEHLPQDVRLWTGDSIGHWEGDTLVVDTTNFTDKTGYRGSSQNLRVIERFTRIDAETILYKFTIDDPETFTRPWTAEYPFRATPGPIFEYACHEGNYAMPDILGGARAAEAAEKK
ncbi:MAG: hypothetical protein LAP38_21715 [Acidobacteriia bacterium]|nr:hypothetical protein [Terriglobia bacterium]